MAAKKKKKTKTKTKAAKKTTKKKTPAKKKAPAKTAVKKKAVKKKAPAKAVKKKAAAKKTAPVKKAKAPARKKQIVGEGDYAASRTFLKDQAGFVKKNKARIPELAKEAEAALDGPEGAELKAAEAAGKSHSQVGPEE